MKKANEYSLTVGGLICLLLTAGCNPPPAPLAKAAVPPPLPSPSATDSFLPLLPQTVRLTGSLQAVQEVAVSPKSDAQRVAAVSVREGDAVRAGQILLRLDSRDISANARAAAANVAQAQAAIAQAVATYRQEVATTQSAVSSAEAGLLAARANLGQTLSGSRSQETAQLAARVRIAETNLAKAETDLARYARLLEKGAVAPVEVEQYRATRAIAAAELAGAREALSLSREGARSQEIARARAEVAQATEALRQARAATAQNDVRRAGIAAARAALAERANAQAVANQAVADTVIRAPIAGRVSLRDAEPGQIVGTANTLFRLVAPAVRFEPSVPETEVRYVAVGTKIAVAVDALPGQTFTGRVQSIAPTGQAGRAFAVRIALHDPRRVLRPGMFARAEIATKESR